MGNRFYYHLLVTILLGVTFVISEQEILEGGSRVKHPGRHAVKSIQNVAWPRIVESDDGDTIDCIDIYKQPAFDHPALRDHVIQMAPTYDPSTAETMAEKRATKTKTRTSMTSQIWKKSGSCPEGTIPIRRIQNTGLLKSNSVEAYGKKKPTSFHHPVKQLNDNEYPDLLQPNRSKAILLTVGYIFSGAKADIKVWNPYVESFDEYSTSRVSLQNGPYYNFENVESGWAVNPSVYGDTQTRFYVYWTADASNTTGCFDLTCPGFVQTSKEIALGAPIYPISVVSGLPYQITVFIYKDPNTSNWWVQYGERTNIGYWPHDLFTLLPGGAETAEWGGEVYSSRLGHPPHTATAMGSGHLADYTSWNSGVMTRMRVLENSRTLKFPEWVDTYADEYRCYDVDYLEDYIEDPEFYYGGPGRNLLCP